MFQNFKVLHSLHLSIDGKVDEDNVHTFKHVANVRASSLEEAWLRAQNDFSNAYAKLKIRSTCVGDILVPENKLQKPMLVMNRGFQEVPEIYWNYIKAQLKSL